MGMPNLYMVLEEGIRHERGGAPELALACFEQVLQSAEAPDLRSRAWRAVAGIRRARCEWNAALEAARESAGCAKIARSPNLLAEALNAEGLVQQSRGRFAAARGIYLEMLSVTDDERIRGIAFQNLGSLAAVEQDLEAAERYFAESAGCFERAGYGRGSAIAATNSAAAALDRGDHARARILALTAVSRAQLVGDLDLVAIAEINLAEALLGCGAHPEAEAAASRALGHFTSTSNKWRSVQALRIIGDCYAAESRNESAMRAWERALDFAAAIDAPQEETQLRQRLEALPRAAPLNSGAPPPRWPEAGAARRTSRSA